MDPVAERMVDCACETGECPLWHPTESRLYWVDIPAGRLHRFDPRTGKAESHDVGAAVGGFTIQRDGALLLFMARGAVRVWREGAVATVLDSVPGEEENRFNDVIADPEGRVFCGTMSTPKRPGRLYRLDRDRRIHVLLEGIGTSNGLGFTADRRGLFYTDTRARQIYRFDYDARTGDIGNRTVFVTTPEGAGEGRPDGLTVDAEGCVWSARWDGGCVVRYAPDGREITRIRFPAPKVSSITFGGEDYSDLYATTAGGNRRETDGPMAGSLFRVRTGTQGVPEFRSDVR